MNTSRLNITLPKELARRLDKVPNKSRYIAEAIGAKMGEEESRHRLDALAEAYKLSASEDARLAAEWDATSGDGI